MYDIKLINQEILKSNFINLTIPKGVHLVIHYLSKIYPHKTSKELYNFIIFKSNSSLSFPKSEISNIEFIKDKNKIYVSIELNFLTIFGSGTPLPLHYAEQIKDDTLYKDGVLIDFLNIFNHHLQKMIYPIWKKQRYYVGYQNDLQDKFSTYLLSILGLYPQTKDDKKILDFHKLLPYLGILSMKQKSSGTLISIIQHYISHYNIKIDECVVSKAYIPQWQKNRMGEENCILGSSFIIGDFITVRNVKFRINLYDIEWKILYEYSTLGSRINKLKDLISFSLNEPLDFDLALNINKKDIKSIFLTYNNPNDIFLGINSWIGEVCSNETIIIQP